MRAFVTSLLLLLVVSVTARGQARDSLIDPEFQVPDLSGSVARLEDRFQGLAERLAAMRAGQQLEGVDARLEELFLPAKPDAFRRRYAPQLSLAEDPTRLATWRQLAGHYLEAGRVDDAAAAAYHIHRASKVAAERAGALDTMAEAALARGEGLAAANLYAKALELEKAPDRNRRFRVLRQRYELRVKDLSLDVEQARPAACVVFSQKLERRVLAHPEDYVSLSPAQDVDIHARDAQICFRGLRFGARLELLVKPGVQGVDGGRLYAEARRRFTVPDRAERIGFDRNAYVLPQARRRKLPMTTVNLDRVALRLYRIVDRNLATAVLSGALDRDLYTGAENQIGESTGSLIWRGSVAVEAERNQEVTTLVALDSMLGEQRPGIYALVARRQNEPAAERWREHATQWLVVTDLGLTAFEGRDGLAVVVRRLADAAPVAEARLSLVARNNTELSNVVTDAAGVAHFPPGQIRGKGGDRPALVTVETAIGDYNFLRLAGAELDLSERGVAGRVVPAAADAFLYTERGVYRPGETVRLSALLRDPVAVALAELPLTVKVVRPGGTEMFAKTRMGDVLGGYGFDIPLSDAARAGTWTATAYLDAEGRAVGAASFQVEDFVPLRIAAELSAEKAYLEPGERARLDLEGKFLYGAPAADLKVEAKLTLKRNPTPFANYKNFHFGLVQEEFRPRRRGLKAPRTDARGHARIGFDLDALPDTSHPLLAEVRASLIDVGGRPVDAILRLPVRARAVEVGVRLAQKGSLGPGDQATFEVIALDVEGRGVPRRRLAYRWVREHHDYSWYQHGGRWQTRVTVTDEVTGAGEISLDDEGEGALVGALAAGRYRFEVADTEGGSAASQRFFVGWWASSRLPDVPDALELSLQRSDLGEGETLKAFVRAPFAGTALIAVLSDRLLHLSTMALPEAGAEVALPVASDWGPGAYLMVTALRPDNGKPSLLPVRATGLAWFSIDRARRTLGLEIETPEAVLPRQSITLPLRVHGAEAGETLRLTLAAVDEGILRLTGFRSPDPAAYFLGQRRLGVRIRDLYGRLIRAADGKIGQPRSGGDARLQASLENFGGPKTRTVRTVALYHRNIVVDDSGHARVRLALPDFNGRLRLMAVAYGKSKIGAGEADLVVRDPIVADVILPRFLAPGDQAEATLSLHNLSGAPLVARVAIETEGGIVVAGAPPRRVELADRERRDTTFALLGQDVGEGRLRLVVETEGREAIERHWEIAVRPAWTRQTQRHVTFLEPRQTVSGAGLPTDDFMAGTATTMVTVAGRPDFDAPALLADLRLYPYGCTEQTISRALPLVHAGEVARAWGATVDDLDIQRTVDRAIAKVLNRQRGDGAFAAWQSFGKRHPWLTAYVFDFLTQARAGGFDVPRAAYDHGQAWLRKFASRRGGNELYAQAYALYVLARVGALKASEARYFTDAYAGRIRTRLGLGHLAATLAMLGERRRAEGLFEAAIEKRRPTGVGIRDYGSDLRDGAALAALMAEAATGASRRLRLVETLERRFDRARYLSTQEQAWLLLAARALGGGGAPLEIRIDDERIGPERQPIRRRLDSGSGDGLEVENLGQAAIRVIETRRGVPSTAPPPVESGFTLRRSYFATDGGAVDPTAIRQHDQIVVLIEGEAALASNHEALVVDLLPAGLEIENAALGAEGGTGGFEFLPPLTKLAFEAARDDRYVAAVELSRRQRKFALAYVARAVTPGRYVLPGSFVEDMYMPRYHARTEAQTLTVRR